MIPKPNSRLRSLGVTATGCMVGGALVFFLFGLCIDAPAIASKERRIDELDNLEAQGRRDDAIRQERIALRKEMGGVLFEFPVKAVEGPKWGSLVGVAFGSIFGLVCFGVAALGSADTETSQHTQGYAILGGILGAIVGVLFGLVGGTVGMLLPLLAGMSVYGACMGLAAGCIIKAVPR